MNLLYEEQEGVASCVINLEASHVLSTEFCSWVVLSQTYQHLPAAQWLMENDLQLQRLSPALYVSQATTMEILGWSEEVEGPSKWNGQFELPCSSVTKHLQAGVGRGQLGTFGRCSG